MKKLKQKNNKQKQNKQKKKTESSDVSIGQSLGESMTRAKKITDMKTDHVLFQVQAFNKNVLKVTRSEGLFSSVDNL